MDDEEMLKNKFVTGKRGSLPANNIGPSFGRLDTISDNNKIVIF